ncbi:ABC transporter permease [Occallatibacter savannae]|uniref:ABC transporter permease n=1 Tax=Occallatibacter savannae TaxID=1002691 RepID=UPI001EF41C92|nr:ABC transporter permease [Occallatibacter savannae]
MSRFIHNTLQDVRYALRQLRKSPGFTFTAIVTLALGIGANTAIFTLVQQILLRRLPVNDPRQLYRIGDTDDCCVDGGFQNDNGDFAIFSYDLYRQLRDTAPEFEQLAAVQSGQNSAYVRRGEQDTKNLRTEYVTGNFFTTFGIGPYMGRVFSAADDQPGAAPVLVLSYASWQGDFGGDPSVVGSTVFIQTHPFTVAGIAPPGFFGDRVSNNPPAIWIPINNEPLVEGANSILHNGDQNWLYPIGRVRPGTSIPALTSKLSTSLRQFLNTRPIYVAFGAQSEIAKQHVVLSPAGGGIQNLQIETGRGIRMLMILATVVLLIACANIANLLLARTTTRRGEIAIRMSMGAARTRLVSQMITESVLLACCGGLAGIAVAYLGSRMILSLAFPASEHMAIDATPSFIVLAFAFTVSLITGLLFAIAPAWMSSHAQPAEALRGVNRSTRDSSSLPQKALVVVQAMLSVVLISAAILMTRSLGNLEHQNFGVQTANRYVVHFDPAGAGYTIPRLPEMNREIQNRFSALPGVTHVALALYPPLDGNNWSEGVFVQGHAAPKPNDASWSTWDRVTPGFLDAIGVSVVHGRNISDQDTAATQPIAIVNQAFVKRFFPNEDPIGKHFGVGSVEYGGAFEIVGVFADFKINSPREVPRRVFLRPMTQQFNGFKEKQIITGESRSMYPDSIILSFNHPQQQIEELARRTLRSIDPNLTITRVGTFDAQVADNFTQDRLLSRLTTLFGVIALILASVGLYGVMSYFVARRTSEIGVRMALGATRTSVVAMVFRSALVQVIVGFALGIPAALLAGHLMASQLYGVGAYDPLSISAASLVLALCAAVAVLVPARRAATIEPMRALRIE